MSGQKQRPLCSLLFIPTLHSVLEFLTFSFKAISLRGRRKKQKQADCSFSLSTPLTSPVLSEGRIWAFHISQEGLGRFLRQRVCLIPRDSCNFLRSMQIKQVEAFFFPYKRNSLNSRDLQSLVKCLLHTIHKDAWQGPSPEDNLGVETETEIDTYISTHCSKYCNQAFPRVLGPPGERVAIRGQLQRPCRGADS